MASNRHEERLAEQLREEAELEAAFLAQNGQGPAEKEKPVLENEEVFTPEGSFEADNLMTVEQPVEKTTPKDTTVKPSEVEEGLRKELADAIHRYNRYKGSTDRTLFELRNNVAALTDQLTASKKEIILLNKTIRENQPKEQIFDNDAVEIFGEDATNAIKEAMEKQAETIRKLEEKLDSKETDELSKESERMDARNQSDFLAGLTDLVPDQAVLNDDPDFNQWLREAGSDGVIRLDRLRAYARKPHYDYHRVAEFFIEYKSTLKKETKKIVQDSIANHIGPKSTRTTESNSQLDESKKGQIRQSEINEFNRKVAKGGYKNDPKGAELFEARVFRAMGENKIIMDENPL